MLLSSLAGLLGNLLTSGLSYWIRLPERKLYPRWRESTLILMRISKRGRGIGCGFLFIVWCPTYGFWLMQHIQCTCQLRGRPEGERREEFLLRGTGKVTRSILEDACSDEALMQRKKSRADPEKFVIEFDWCCHGDRHFPPSAAPTNNGQVCTTFTHY